MVEWVLVTYIDEVTMVRDGLSVGKVPWWGHYGSWWSECFTYPGGDTMVRDGVSVSQPWYGSWWSKCWQCTLVGTLWFVMEWVFNVPWWGHYGSWWSECFTYLVGNTLVRDGVSVPRTLVGTLWFVMEWVLVTHLGGDTMARDGVSVSRTLVRHYGSWWSECFTYLGADTMIRDGVSVSRTLVGTLCFVMEWVFSVPWWGQYGTWWSECW